MEKYTFDFELLKKLCLANGVSGFEDEVRDIIKDEILLFCDSVMTDAAGNLLAFKKGGATPSEKLMICAHMDEVGFCVKHINDDGTLLVDEVGMVTPIMPSKRVTIGNGKIPGVIGSKPVHLSGKSDGIPSIRDIFIDIGARDKKDAESMDVFGQYAAFESDFCEFGDGLIKAKALDDRIGCAIMCMLARTALPCDVYFAFTVGEEIGGTGAAAAAYRISPDVCLVLEGTTASDLAGITEENAVCRIGGGPVSPFIDRGTMYDSEIYSAIRAIADKNGIPCQSKTKIAGGTDARNIAKSKGGIRVGALSLACRYIHTPSSVAAKCDMQNMLELSALFINEFARGIRYTGIQFMR